jgi:hypothetical protein
VKVMWLFLNVDLCHTRVCVSRQWELTREVIDPAAGVVVFSAQHQN